MIKVYFNNIEQQVASSVLSANKRVYVAVAWFTNQVLFNCLETVLKRNVEVKVLILDDILNRSEFGLDFGVLESSGAEVCLAESAEGLMHNKFCIIDDKVITGSYNWTYHANKNNENILISDDAELVANYCEQFYELFCIGKGIELPYKHLKWTDIKEGEFSEFRKNICSDVVANKKDINGELKRAKLIALDEAYKSGNRQNIIAADNISIKLPIKTIIDVLTNQYQNCILNLWKENTLGKPYDNVDGYSDIGKWYYLPRQLAKDKDHREYVEGKLKTFDSKDHPLAEGLELNIYDKEFITEMRRFLRSESSSAINWRQIPEEILQIDNAKMFFYPFPYPMFNNSQPRWKYGKPRTITAINVFGLIKSVDGEKIIFYEGWNPNERGKKIEDALFTK